MNSLELTDINNYRLNEINKTKGCMFLSCHVRVSE